MRKTNRIVAAAGLAAASVIGSLLMSTSPAGAAVTDGCTYSQNGRTVTWTCHSSLWAKYTGKMFCKSAVLFTDHSVYYVEPSGRIGTRSFSASCPPFHIPENIGWRRN